MKSKWFHVGGAESGSIEEMGGVEGVNSKSTPAHSGTIKSTPNTLKDNSSSTPITLRGTYTNSGAPTLQSGATEGEPPPPSGAAAGALPTSKK